MATSTENFPRVGSAVVITNSNGEILLGKRAKRPGFGEWILPGGKINPFETIESAAIREAKEELGVDIEITKRIGVYELITAETHRIINYSLAKLSPAEQNLKCSDDVSEAKFFSTSQLPSLNLAPFISKVIGDAGLLTQGEVTVKIKAANGAELPLYMTPGSAGADVKAAVSEDVVIAPGKRFAVPTGLFLEIPHGYEVQVRPRSGLAFKHGVTLLNAPGTIDSDYRGEVHAILVNHGDKDFIVKNGDRICQLVVAKVHRASFDKHEELSDTHRGAGGFGSTGV